MELEYKNPWIAEKTMIIEQDIEAVKNKERFLTAGGGKPVSKVSEIRFQTDRLDLLKMADGMTVPTLTKIIKSMQDELTDDAKMILNIGPYDSLKRADFEKVCHVEMLMAAHQFHPDKKG